MLDYLLDQFKKGQQDGQNLQKVALTTPSMEGGFSNPGLPSASNVYLANPQQSTFGPRIQDFAQQQPQGYMQDTNGYRDFNGQAMSLDQVSAFDQQNGIKPLDQQNPNDINNVQVSVGARQGNGGQLAELQRQALVDRVAQENASLGMNPYTNTPQIGTQDGVKDLMAFRASMDKNDTALQNAILKSDMTDKWNQLKMDNANEMLRTRFDLMLRNQQERENNKQKGDDPTPGVQMFYTQQDPTKPPIIEEVPTDSPMYQRYMMGDFASKTRPFGKKGQMKAAQALSSFKYNPNPVTTTYDNNGKVYGTTVKGSAPQVKPAQPTAQPPTISKEDALAELRRRGKI